MIILVTVNCPTTDVADAIADRLIQNRLAASANRYPAIQSRYVWKEKVETATEFPLVVKTRRDLFEQIVETIRAIHPYETPSVVATQIIAANEDCVAWIHHNTDG